MPCMPGSARPEDNSGSEEPETSEAAVAAVATLSNEISPSLLRNIWKDIPKQGAKDIDTRRGERQGA
jgi:hypothetical protein